MNASRYRKFLFLLLITLLTLTPFASAFAAKPEIITIQVDDTIEIGACDGFTVIEHVEGTVKISTHFDQDGNFTMQLIRFSLRHTYTNSETGETLISPDVGIDKITVHQDGSVTIAVIGIVARIVIPGEGLVFAHLGRIVFDASTGEVIFEAGQHDALEDLFPVLCSALA